jgi:diacylglycerol O-acyltransferase / wax synthase
MDRLSPLDAEFVEAEREDRHVSMAIGSTAVFEGPAPSYEEFVDAIGSRLPLVPRYRQKVRTVPFRIGPPVWVDDPHFDIRYHIRQTALPQPGGDEELAQLVARVMAQRLDRDRPLWEDWMVTGLPERRWALISKVHHSMVDGVSGTDLYRVMFDSPGDDIPSPTPVGREPRALELAARAAGDLLLLPARGSGALLTALGRPVPSLRQIMDTAKGMWAFAPAAQPARRSSLTGPIGQQRRFTWVRVPLDDVRAIKAGLGGTVNDAVLAVITAGFRSLLISRCEKPHARMVPSLVPVSLRAPGQENIYDNRVSALIVPLPVHLSDPVEQLTAVRTEVAALKHRGEAAVGQAAAELASYVPYPIASLTRFGFRFPLRDIVTVTTNVPGPRQTLYCLGRPLMEIIPYVPIASSVRIGVAIFSYCDQITFGITGDYDTTPDLDVLAWGITDGVAALLKVAAESPSSQRQREEPVSDPS